MSRKGGRIRAEAVKLAALVEPAGSQSTAEVAAGGGANPIAFMLFIVRAAFVSQPRPDCASKNCGGGGTVLCRPVLAGAVVEANAIPRETAGKRVLERVAQQRRDALEMLRFVELSGSITGDMRAGRKTSA